MGYLMPENNITDNDKIQYWKDLYLDLMLRLQKLQDEHFDVSLFKDLLIKDNIKKSEIIRDKIRIISNLEKDIQSLQLQVNRELNNG
jgi:hypothetical protein